MKDELFLSSLVTDFMIRWQQGEKLCQSALELEEGRRATFLEQTCVGDEDLGREVECLLQFDNRGERFIEKKDRRCRISRS